jgi:hypothetical protein
VDDAINRLVVNYYNRQYKHIELTPGYNNNTFATTYGTSSTTWAQPPATPSTGPTASYISNGEDAIAIVFTSVHELATDGSVTDARIGIGIDSTTTADRGASDYCPTYRKAQSCSVTLIRVLSEGYHTINMLIAVSQASAGWYADLGRPGGDSTDVAATVLEAKVAV